jgi:hypothetical protein
VYQLVNKLNFDNIKMQSWNVKKTSELFTIIIIIIIITTFCVDNKVIKCNITTRERPIRFDPKAAPSTSYAPNITI